MKLMVYPLIWEGLHQKQRDTWWWWFRPKKLMIWWFGARKVGDLVIQEGVLSPPLINGNQARFKYIDDKVAIKISDLELISSPMEKLLNYRDRTLHQLPADPRLLQNKLLEMNKFCKIQQMKILRQ